MDEQDLMDWDDEFLKAATEVWESSESLLPSSPATVPAPPVLKMSTKSTSLTKAVQFQSGTGNLKQTPASLNSRRSYSSLSKKERKRSMDEQVIEDWDEEFLEAVMEVLQFYESSDQLPLPSATVTVFAPLAPKISKISTSVSQADQQIQSAAEKLKDFPVFLRFYKHIYELVDDPSTDSFISWGKSNKSVVVTNPEELVLRKILSRFCCNTFKQFIKWLKYYGIKEIHGSVNVWEFGNSNFVRGQPELMVEMHNVEVQDA